MSELTGKYVTVPWYRGVACYVRGPVKVYEPDVCYVSDPETGEEIPEETGYGEWVNGDGSRLRLVMVGDDREFEADADECTLISDDDFCSDCGQVGCGHGRY
jgi:hypothetical protein